MTRYEGHKAVVIGGAAGFGLAIAKRLVEGGAEVLLTLDDARLLAEAATKLGSCAHLADRDPQASGPAAAAALVSVVEDALGHVDFLFVDTGADTVPQKGPVTEDDYDRRFDAGTKAVYFAVRALLPFLDDGGAIVFTASGAAGLDGTGIDAMTRSALWSFARTLARELAGRGIRVNTVAPGFVDTPWCSRRLSPQERAVLRKLGADLTPLRRHGSAEEVARAALFLAVDATFTTGARLAVDGGLAQLVPAPQPRAALTSSARRSATPVDHQPERRIQ